MDRIFIRDLGIEAVIGIWDWERQVTQRVRIDLEIATDAARAAATDNIDDALNYKAVVQSVTELVQQGEFRLVETMAERIAACVLGEHGAAWVSVRVAKPGAIRGSREVGVIIERSAG